MRTGALTRPQGKKGTEIKMMTNTEFVRRISDVADNYETLYVMGCFGAPMTEKNKARYCKNQAYNEKPERTAKIKAASADTFGFDCVCLIKGILWGWDGDASATYGGAVYGSNGVPDIGTEQIITVCKDVSENFAEIEVGELLWKKGHVGVYIGGGIAVECSPAWEDGVQYTAVGNIGKKAGYNTRTWTKHGKLPYVEYVEYLPEEAQGVIGGWTQNTSTVTELKMIDVSVPVVKKGVKCEAVMAVQTLLNMHIGAGLDIDGSCGAKTDAAIRAFQSSYGLMVDGSCGKATWTALLG